MPITKDSGRQWPLVAKVAVGFADIVSGVSEAAVVIPQGATVISGYVNVTEAYDSGTSDAIEVGDPDTVAEYLASTSIAATGITALVPTGKKYTVESSINVEVTSVGAAATAGIVELIVEYVLDDRGNEVQPGT